MNKKNKYRVALLTVTQMDIGITALAGVLRSENIPTMIVSLQTDEYGDPECYAEELVSDLLDLLNGVDFIGISVFDMFFKRALFIADKIKTRYPDTVLFMGGIHAELYPDECLDSASVDAVCIGDGYKAIVDIVTKWEKRGDGNISNTLVKNADGSIRRPNHFDFFDQIDLNNLPIPDYSYEHYWMLIDEKLRWMGDYNETYSFSHHQIGHKNTYVVSFMTGCMHKCLYCNNWGRIIKYDAYARKSLPKARYKSSKRIIEELKLVVSCHDVDFFNIMDNDFFIRPIEEISDFAKAYKQEIDIPFYVMGSPDTVSREKISALVDAGLVELNIGIQSINRVNRSMYNRDINDEDILEMTGMVNEFVTAGKIDVFYDFIIFNAAMTRQDLIDTINFIRLFPTPFDQVSHHLTLGPQVPLYHKFMEEKIVLPRDIEMMYRSNFHEFDFNEYRTFPNLYYHLILEWMAGRHDGEFVGRLPRSPENFVRSNILNPVRRNRPMVYKIFLDVSEKTTDIRDFLLHDKVIKILENNHDVLEIINAGLPELLYTNQKNAGVYRDHE